MYCRQMSGFIRGCRGGISPGSSCICSCSTPVGTPSRELQTPLSFQSPITESRASQSTFDLSFTIFFCFRIVSS